MCLTYFLVYLYCKLFLRKYFYPEKRMMDLWTMKWVGGWQWWLWLNGWFIFHDVSADPTADPEDLSDAPIILCNHSSYIDGPVILGKTGRPKVFAINIVR